MSPLYDWECLNKECQNRFEAEGVPEENQTQCPLCGRIAEKRFTKLTTSWKGKDRKWGTSLYRSHEKGKKVEKPKMPTFIPREIK